MRTPFPCIKAKAQKCIIKLLTTTAFKNNFEAKAK